MRKKLNDLVVRFRNLFVEYGVIAIAVHYVIFALVIVAFWAAIRAGWQPTGAAGSVGTWTAAYVATKVTQPLRIVATLAVTPFARWGVTAHLVGTVLDLRFEGVSEILDGNRVLARAHSHDRGGHVTAIVRATGGSERKM